MAVGWEFYLADVASLNPYGKLRGAADRTLSVDLNKSGSASGSLATSNEMSKKIWPWSTALVVQYTTPERESFIFWSGLVNSRKTSLASGRVSFSAVGWFERLMHLNLQDQTLEFANQDAGAIVTVLLAKALELDPRLPITIGTVETTQLRTITYNLDQNIGQAILDLVELEAGFDFYIHPITRQLNIVSRLGDVRPAAKWTFLADRDATGFQLSQHSNLSDVEEDVDGAVVNDIRPRGSFGSGYAVDVESQAQYGVFMEAPSLSDVVDNDILNAYANAEIVYRAQPRVVYTMTPKPSTHPKALKLFRDFDIGDTTFLTARRDFIDIVDQATRIFGVSLNIGPTGVETLTNVQTTAS